MWSVVCFFIAKPFRRQCLSAKSLSASVEYAKGPGATIIEGYPVEPAKGNMPDIFSFTGIASAFRDAGFNVVARHSSSRPLMRYFVERSEEEMQGVS